MKTILVIDDEQLIRERLKDLLELDDYEVFTADCGEKGLQCVKENRPQVALVDIRMPGMDGTEILKRIKEDAEETEVIIMTGHATIDTAVQSLKMGAFGFISKPVDYHNLIIEIERAFDKWSIREKLGETKKKLTESDVRFRTLFETMTQGVVHHDHTGRIISANPAAERILGVLLAQMEGKTSLDLFGKAALEDGSPFPGDGHPASVALRTGQRVVDTIIGVYNPRMDGYRWIMVSAIPQFHNVATTPYEIHVTFTDITERKQAEESLKESEKKYRQLVEMAQEGIWAIDNDANTSYANPRMSEILGYTVEEMLGRSLYSFMDERGIEIANRNIERRKQGISEEHDFEFIREDGQLIYAKLSTSPITDSEGGYIGALALVSDVTEQRLMEVEKERLQAQLNQAQKLEAIGTLAGGIAHDFNNILMAVTGFAQVAINEPDAEERRQDLNHVLLSCERARNLVKQILVFSRQSEYVRKPLEIAVMVKEALKLLRASMPTTIEFRQKIASEQIMVLADPTQIHQIMMNLCTNAAQAMMEGGVLEVDLESTEFLPDTPLPSPDLKPGPYAKLVLSDTGKGISPANVGQIFNPFFTTKPVGEGTGLGLSVVYGIVKGYEGAITVRSDMGRGTTFTVYLPRIEAAMTQDNQPVSTIPRGREQLLFVDDEETICSLGKRMLEPLGYHVTCCGGSVEALDLFLKEPNRFDLVITDMTMPKMTGTKLARKMMDLRPDIPIILCTGYNNLITAEQAKIQGLRAFLLKPVRQHELAEVIRDVLDCGPQVKTV